LKKILGRGGASLGTTYDVEGSTVAVDKLADEEVHLVDAMGNRIHSERLCTIITQSTTGVIATATAFNVDLSAADPLPDCPHRLVSINVIALGGNETDFVLVSMRDPATGREQILWAWDLDNDQEQKVRWVNDGVGPATDRVLVQLSPVIELPIIVTRIGLEAQSGMMPTFHLRGQTAAAGAGETYFVQMVFVRPASVSPLPGEPTSHGLPIPSW